MKHDISYFTARKQIAYELSQEALDELVRYEQSLAFQASGIPLASNLRRLQNVLNVDYASGRSGLVYVEFDAKHGDDSLPVEEVGDIIVAYAMDALSIAEFIPQTYEPRAWKEPVDRSQPWEHTLRRLVHAEPEFVVTHVRATDTAEIHFLRNGIPTAQQVEFTSEIAARFAPVIADERSAEGADPMLPTRGDEEVRVWAASVASIPDLDRAMKQSQDFGWHRLGDVVHGKDVVYADNDVIVTGGREYVVHFESDARYSVNILRRDTLLDAIDLIATPGLDPMDSDNPFREWLRGRIKFDEACEGLVLAPSM